MPIQQKLTSAFFSANNVFLPSRHATSERRFYNVVLTLWCRYNVHTTSFQRHVPAKVHRVLAWQQTINNSNKSNKTSLLEMSPRTFVVTASFYCFIVGNVSFKMNCNIHKHTLHHTAFSAIHTVLSTFNSRWLFFFHGILILPILYLAHRDLLFSVFPGWVI